MIDFELPTELALLRDTARAFAEGRLRPRERVSEVERGVGDELLRLHREIGLAGVGWPEALGGAGLGALAQALVREELAAADAGAALALDPVGAALDALRIFGGDEALERFAAPIVERRGARALLVYDAAPHVETHSGLARGTIAWVPADRLDLVVVLERERAYLVADALRFEARRGAGLRAAGASTLHIDGAPIVAEWVSTPGARAALAAARLEVAALLVGVARRAAEFSRAYALERVAFGRPIAHHQALAFQIADMAGAVEAARHLVIDAAWRIDSGLAADEACATAFVECVEASMFVAPRALQILGGHGFMQDHPVEKYLRDARALGLLAGGVDLSREDASRAIVASRGAIALAADDPLEGIEA
jgi:alkylation response protein AidB-like acyl-CoA dehydrogenase